MPAYSFHKRFVEKVESGEKTHTIRGKRKSRPRPGQTAYLYQGMRTKACRKLLESPITRVDDILLTVGNDDKVHVYVNDVELAEDERELLAKRDGFSCWKAMVLWWNGLYPFRGDIIHWQPPSKDGAA